MHRFWIVVAILLVSVAGIVWVLFGAGKSTTSRYTAATSPQAVTIRSCDFSSRYGFSVDCYWAHLKDGDINAKLSVAVFRAQDKDPAADPLVYIPGGPGESGNTDSGALEIWDEWLSRNPIKRDFVLIDPRGLPLSEPAWDCTEYITASEAMLSRHLSFAEEAELITPVLQNCLRMWQRKIHGARGPVEHISEFSSTLYANDLARVLPILSYKQWNYLAVSYGTRVALLAAALQPQVRRLILDSPYPFDRGALSDSVTLWSDAFAEFWLDCRETGCAFDETRFWSLMESLKREPVWVEVEDWQTGRKKKWLLNDGRLAAALYTAFYSSELRAGLAEALAAYVRGERGALLKVLEVFYNQVFDKHFNSAIYWAVECNDNPLEGRESFDGALHRAGPWRPYFSADWQYNICREPDFRPGQLPPMRKLTIPVLLAVGSLDPITTQAHARSLMASLSAGHLLVLEGRSHAEFFAGDCGQQLISWFLTAADQMETDLSARAASCQPPVTGGK